MKHMKSMKRDFFDGITGFTGFGPGSKMAGGMARPRLFAG